MVNKMEELKKLEQYATDNGIKVVYTDSKILKDYAAMNPEAARAMGFPDIDNKLETKEILIDKNVSEAEQVKNLKHELIEMRLMREGMEYWDAHTIALRDEDKPFDYSKPIEVEEAIEPEPISAPSYYSQPTIPTSIESIPAKKKRKGAFKKGRSYYPRSSGYKLDFEGFKDF